MAKVAGIVSRVNPRNTRVGVTYSFILDGVDGPDGKALWFGTFKSQPPQEGQYCEFEYTTNSAGFHNVDMKTLVVTESTANDTETAEPTSRERVGTPAKKAYGAASNRDANIQWQSARNAAIAFLNVAVPGGAVGLGSGSKEAKLEMLTILTNRLTLEFFDQSMEVSETGDAPEDFR